MASIDRNLWPELDQLLDQALELTGASREQWLEQLRADAPELAGPLTALLSADALADFQNWVAGGGRLVLNAAPWNIGMNYGFGGIALTFDVSYSSADVSATAVNGTHPIFQGPFSPVGTAFSGNYFSHAFVSGGGINSIINDSQGRSVLADKKWGNGYLMVGGMTNSFFHGPNPEAANLASNILNYADQTSTVPEPGTYALMAAGLAGIAFAGRKRRRRTAVAS